MNKKLHYINNRFMLWGLVGMVLGAVLIGTVIVTFQQEEKYGMIFLFLCILGVYLLLGYQFILKPFRQIDKAFLLFAEGYLLQDIFKQQYALSPSVEAAIKKFEEVLGKRELLNINIKQAEYIALQNQINPHFLYNTLEGIRSEALYAGMGSVADMTETLAMFFRYTISNIDHLVSLEDEITNVENYFSIQRYRFGDKLNLRIDCDEDREDVLKLKMPKLTLQPIVENAIRHGIESKIGKGTVHIKIHSTQQRLIIIISDDGIGMSKENTALLNQKLRTTMLEEGDGSRNDKDAAPAYTGGNTMGGIAIGNVNNRIKLLFGDEYGIYFYSTPNIGTDVEITLPKLS